MQLDRHQSDAVRIGDGPALILAGPGSGKTTVITHRVLELIRVHGVPPPDILVITFTRAAADEMQARFRTISGGVRRPVTFGTFHSVFFAILRQTRNYDSNSIIRLPQKKTLLREALLRSGIESSGAEEYLTALADEISSVKGSGLALEGYHARNLSDEEFAAVYSLYGKMLHDSMLLDFDDMLIMTSDLLRTRPDVLERCRQQYR